MGKIWAVVAVATGIIVVGLIIAVGSVESAYSRGLAEGASKATHTELKRQFDKGMAAGVEYEEWFCKNPEYDVSGD